MSVLLGMTGFVPNYGLLLVLTSAAGIGTAAFHPQVSAMVGQVVGTRKGFILAAFVAMGNTGAALSPMIFLDLFNSLGIHSTGFAVIPGIISALKKSPRELSKLVIAVALRSLVNISVTMLLPMYFLERNFSTEIVGYLMFATLASGAIGGLIGGYISDKYGRKAAIVASMFLPALFFMVFYIRQGLYR